MSSRVTRIVVHGALGRMGARLCALASSDPAFHLVGAIDTNAHATGAHVDITGAPADLNVENTLNPSVSCDVIIDFSSDEGAASAAELALRRNAALLVGTTGLSAHTHGKLAEAAQRTAILICANTSAGIAILADSVRRISRLLADDCHCSIVESHHAAKLDAPSGTALRLAQAVRNGGADMRDDQILSLRGGDVIGEHTIRFACAGEYIELTHRATSRDLFVLGALRAAAWLHGRAPGAYTIEDVLGLK